MDAAVSSRCTGPFRIFTLTSLRCLAAGKRGPQPPLSPGSAGTVRERRNAENLSETVPASARVMQRFLAESPWDDDTVIGRLQEYLGPCWDIRMQVWVLDGSDFPKQGRKSVGVAGSIAVG